MERYFFGLANGVSGSGPEHASVNSNASVPPYVVPPQGGGRENGLRLLVHLRFSNLEHGLPRSSLVHYSWSVQMLTPGAERESERWSNSEGATRVRVQHFGVQLDFIASGAIHAFSMPRLLTNLTAAAALLIAIWLGTGFACGSINRHVFEVLKDAAAASARAETAQAYKARRRRPPGAEERHVDSAVVSSTNEVAADYCVTDAAAAAAAIYDEAYQLEMKSMK